MRLLLLAAIVALYAVIKSNATPITTDVESSTGNATSSSSTENATSSSSTENATSSSSTDADIDAKRQAGLELVIDLARNFSIKYFELVTYDMAISQTFSPLLDFLSLSLFSYATQGRARTKLAESLGFPGHDHEILELGFQTLIDRLNNYTQPALSVNNEIHHSYGDATTKEFSKLTKEVFRLSMEYDGSLSQITKMPCSFQCFNILLWKIRLLFASDQQNVFMNSAKFKGQWKVGFNYSLSWPRLFWINNWQTIYTETMNVKGTFRYGKIPRIGSPFVEIPFMSNDGEDGVSMFVIRSTSAYDYYLLLRQLGEIDFKRLIRENSMKHVDLYLPKFNIETSRLGSSWIPQFFGTNGSELYKIIPKDVVNKIAIDVSEDRSTFSAKPKISRVTRDVRTLKNAEIVFEVNRPFVAIIVATGANIIELSTTIVSGDIYDFIVDDDDYTR